LADEPTGALDTATSHEIMALLTELNLNGTTIALAKPLLWRLVTHDPTVAAQTKRIVNMQDGAIVEKERIGK
jgi:putative ABC transport system ATP-binding protein